MLRALFAGFVSGHGTGATAEGRERLTTLSARYVGSKGPHAALAAEWAAAVR